MSVSGMAQKRQQQDSRAKASHEHEKSETKSAPAGKLPSAKGTASQQLKSLEKASGKTVRSKSGTRKQTAAASKTKKEKPKSSINFGGKAGGVGSNRSAKNGRGSNPSKGRLKEKRGHR
jgi:hypothetical protein